MKSVVSALTKRPLFLTSALIGQSVTTALLLATATSYGEAIDSVTLINNQPFPIHQPIEIRGATAISTSDGIQQSGSNLVFIADTPASAQRNVTFKELKPPVKQIVAVTAADRSITITACGNEIGSLSWDIVIDPAKKRGSEGDLGTKQDFATRFQPLPLSFKRIASGSVFDTWSAEGSKSGLQLKLEMKVYHDGFIDWTARITNESAPTSNVYGAIICRWQHPMLKDRVLCYDNRRKPFPATAYTGFRTEDQRYWHMSHGIDWVRSKLSGGPTVLWLNPFNPSFTVLAEETSKNPARYTGGNQAQLATEAQSIPSAFFYVTEIARPNTKSLRDRFRENVLPPHGDSFDFSGRLVVTESTLSDAAADQMFVAYTGYAEQRNVSGKREVVYGVRSVRFGTSYFPYSTLGENFDGISTTGLDRDAFWPLAADTVNKWKLFADDIRRDLRIAKWMGFKLIRLHHLELLAPIDRDIRQQYLDFIFNELRHLELKALVDVYATPEQLTELLQRYGDAVDTVEVENEILIWGIPVDRPKYWNEIYDAVKRTAPHVRVHWTAQNNTGIFERMENVGVRFDRLGLHAYVDSLDAIPSTRGWALSAANEATKLGKAPVITEWNWRQLTRMTPEARAKVYPQIIEGAIATRSIPDFYQFQFNETMSPNLRVGRGNILRHYELLNLSRHPKRDAIELTRIIQRYSAPEDGVRQVGVTYGETVLDKTGKATATISLTNLTSAPFDLTMLAETPEGMRADIESPTLHLKSGQSKKLKVALTVNAPQPGFYHCFLRLLDGGRLLRYGVIEARMPGKPTLDFARQSKVVYPNGVPNELALDLDKIGAVVYCIDSSVLEVETAFVIAQTLESATGRLVPLYQVNDLPAGSKSGSLIVVGTKKSNSLIAPLNIPTDKSSVFRSAGKGKAPWLIITGADSEDVEKAGLDFLLRYWVNAKDSAARRIGLVEKQLPRGIDPTKLP